MENMKGCAREFPLFGQILRVPAEMDIFNTYRLMFRDLDCNLRSLLAAA